MFTKEMRKKALRIAEPKGPIWLGQFVQVQLADEDTGQNYTLLFLPDKNNDLLRAAGKPMNFYYTLAAARFAEHSGGHYMFHLQKFSGVMDPAKNIGADGYSELAGGYLTFTTTLGVPEAVMARAIEDLEKLCRSQYSHNKLFSRDGTMPPPSVGPVNLADSQVRLHHVSAMADGAALTDTGDLQPWAWDLQGAGAGNINPVGTNAFSAMLGQYPVQLVEKAARSGTSNLVVEYDVKYKVWSPVSKIEISGSWESIYDHLSGQAKFGSFFGNSDLQAEFNKMQKEGMINVVVEYDSEFGGTEMGEQLSQTADAVADQMTALAQTAILDVQKPEVAAAKAGSSKGIRGLFGGGSVGFALKKRKDISTLDLHYSKEIHTMVSKKSRISTTLIGLADSLGDGKEAEARYFSEIFLEEGFRKIHVMASANANWPTAEGGKGDPIQRLAIQVGYPDSEGSVQWKSAARFSDDSAGGKLAAEPTLAAWKADTQDRIYVFDFTRHDGENAESILVKKTVSFQEDPRVKQNEIVEQIETDQHTIEVRAESAGTIRVPVSIDMPIDQKNVSVHVRMHADGFDDEVFEFSSENYENERVFQVWYAQSEDVKPWKYQVEAIVKGKKFGQSSLRWKGPWVGGEGSGSLVAEIPEVPEEMAEKLEAYMSFDQPSPNPAE